MPARFLPTVWNWLRARASEWTAMGFLPPRAEPLRWPHRVRLYLACVPVVYGAIFLLLFLYAPLVLFGFAPPRTSPAALYHALIHCLWLFFSWDDAAGIWADFGYLTLPALPLWIFGPFWNRRAARLARQNAAHAAPIDIVWPPPPTRPDV